MQNVGKMDRIIRIILGLVLLSLVFLVPTQWGWLGLIFLITGLVSWCPIYAGLKMKTN